MPAADEIFEDFCTQVAEKVAEKQSGGNRGQLQWRFWKLMGYQIGVTHEIWNFQVNFFVKSQISQKISLESMNISCS